MNEVPAGAGAVISALTNAPDAPVKILVAGGVGTGKSTLLAAIRTALRAGGIAVAARPGPPQTAVVIDDAHLLPDTELEALTALVLAPESTVVVSTEPLEHRAALRDLMTAIERENPRVTLGAWSRLEAGRHAGAQEREIAPAELATVMATTAGLPFLVDAALSASTTGTTAGTAEATGTAVFFALVERLRRTDEPVLDALLIASLSLGVGAADVAAALGVDIDRARELVDRAHSTGLLDPSFGRRFRAQLHRAVAQLLGAARHHEIETALLHSQLELSTLTTDLALSMAEHGMREPGLAAALETAAKGVRGHSADAVRIYRAALDAGADTMAAPLADALALSGDCSGAVATADTLLGSEDPARRAAAVRIAASVATHDGNSGHGAELFGWLGPDSAVSAPAALVLIATGDAAAARAALGAPHTGPPTSAARASRSLAEGLLLTLEQPYAVAMARLGQALAALPGNEATPDSPAAVVALTALHAGDAVRARSVLGRAVRGASQDGERQPDPMFDHRHRLLQAWLKMQDGQLQAAAADLAAVPEHALHARDALWWTSLQTALARRNGDAGALAQHWHSAMDVLAEYSIDLFSLLPLGELWVAAARLRQEDRLTHPLDHAFGLLSRLDNPPAWSLPLHWAGVHAAILSNSPEAMAPHGQALTAAAAGSSFAAALAGGGRAWLRVLANQVEVDEVAAAARRLSQFGLTWEATRLAGQAALQTPDARVSSAMLQVARDLKLAAGQDVAEEAGEPVDGSAVPARSARSATQAPGGSLSDREREVAELLLLGMAYRDIGAQLFISAKTVEHHVARIRRRLGAESRSEMLSMLRVMLTPQA